MRILHVDTGREMRGGQWQAFYLTRALTGSGTYCLILAPNESPFYEKAAAAGIPVQPLDLWSLRKLAPSFEIVHAHDGRAHTLAVLAGVRKLAVSRRVAFPIRRGFASRWKYSRPALFIAVSDHVKRELIAADVKEGRIFVVYDGVPLLDRLPPTDEAVAPATSDPRKGSALAREAALRAGITLNFSSDLARELPGARMFVYITEQEGLGSAVLLAMSAGVPVIASRVGGVPEMVEDGVNGLLTDNAPEAIAACIRRLADNPEWAAELGRQGRHTVESRFTMERMVDGTGRVYQELMSW